MWRADISHMSWCRDALTHFSPGEAGKHSLTKYVQSGGSVSTHTHTHIHCIIMFVHLSDVGLPTGICTIRTFSEKNKALWSEKFPKSTFCDIQEQLNFNRTTHWGDAAIVGVLLPPTGEN